MAMSEVNETRCPSSNAEQRLVKMPEFIIAQGGTHYIADSFTNTDCSHTFADKQLGSNNKDADDQPSVFMMWLYIKI
ncbi:hypothetical protein GGH96_006197 [Coemansia sp. RSA 1972]|nr:hypothetical protein GGH96_006197 [Coemansia sp. RSA 1972]